MVAGEYQIGNTTHPLDPSSVASVVYYGELNNCLNREANGYSLVYNQLYPFEGLQNYSSGIIHHVRLTGIHSLADRPQIFEAFNTLLSR